MCKFSLFPPLYKINLLRDRFFLNRNHSRSVARCSNSPELSSSKPPNSHPALQNPVYDLVVDRNASNNKYEEFQQSAEAGCSTAGQYETPVCVSENRTLSVPYNQQMLPTTPPPNTAHEYAVLNETVPVTASGSE